VFAVADILSLHCPLTSATRGMINRRTLAQMKPGVYIVNTARGGLVDECDLLDALRDGRVAGAGLDVYESEPPSADNPLLRQDNVVPRRTSQRCPTRVLPAYGDAVREGRRGNLEGEPSRRGLDREPGGRWTAASPLESSSGDQLLFHVSLADVLRKDVHQRLVHIFDDAVVVGGDVQAHVGNRGGAPA
jgi:hypothetical protein